MQTVPVGLHLSPYNQVYNYGQQRKNTLFFSLYVSDMTDWVAVLHNTMNLTCSIHILTKHCPWPMVGKKPFVDKDVVNKHVATGT